MTARKNEFLTNLMEDFAVLHNICINDASKYKQMHEILLGIQNALQSGSYDDMFYDEFKQMVLKDLEDIINKSW